ncbi:MAG: serine hydrolase domain-containing protein, partial [Phycicoccus sp.]
MRLFLRVVAGLMVVAVVGVVGLYLYARPLIRTGTGYAAHNSCGVVLLAGRDDPEADLPPNPLVPY